jgi:hypothetical protein
MKKFTTFILLGVFVSCSTLKNPASSLKEDELIYTRKFIGSFIDCKSANPDSPGATNFIRIRTSLHDNYDQLSVYGKECIYSPGDNIYLRSTYLTSGSFGNWEYHIENESSVLYRVCEYRAEGRVLVQNMFK